MHFSATSAVASVLLLLLTSSSFLTTVNAAKESESSLLTGNLQGCVASEDFDGSLDYFPDKFIPPKIFTYNDDVDIFGNKFTPHNTTDLLTITYHKTYKIVTNKFQNKSYLLYQCGTVPPQEEVDSGRHHLILSIPHKGGVGVTQTPQIPPIELLGKRQEILGYIGNPIYVSSPCMMHMMSTEMIETFYDLDDPRNTTKMTAAFLDKYPDAIVFGGPYGDKDGDRVMSVAASQERTNVATFDWIALYAALFNLEAESNKITSETQARYDCSSSNAAILSAEKERQRNLERKPVVLWAQYFNNYNWSVAECPTWDTTYYCEYAKHCGAEILTRPEGVGVNKPEGSRYWYLNDDELIELGKDADIWIYSGKTWDTVYAWNNATMDQFKAVQNKQVYDTQGQGPFSWHEQRLAEYDVVALDFCDIVGTANPNAPQHERRWFRNLYDEDIGELENCVIPEELSQPYVPEFAQCSPLIRDASAANMASVTMLTITLLAVASVYVAFLG